MPQSRPLLSVILPVFNTGRYVANAINSILGQTFRDFELLIVEDGSIDNSLAVIKSFNDPRIKVYERQKNGGKVNACNQVVFDCAGKYLTIHDSDDISDPRRFEKQLEFLEDHPEFGMCGTQFYEMNQKGQRMRAIALETDPRKLRNLIAVDSQFHGPTMIFRRDILDEIGGLYRDFRNKEDVDLSMRIAEKYPVANLNEYLYYYRLVPQGLSKMNFDFLRFEGLKVLQALAEQRRVSGQDCLMRGDHQAYERILTTIGKPYVEDPSLLYRKGISLSVYFGFWRNAFHYAFRAILANPAKWINYRELFYVVKLSITRVLLRKDG